MLAHTRKQIKKFETHSNFRNFLLGVKPTDVKKQVSLELDIP